MLSVRFLGLLHRIPPTGWCKTTEIYSLTIWKGPKSKIKVSVGWFLLGDPREGLLQISPWFLANRPWWSLATHHSSLCLPVCFSVPNFPLQRPAGLITTGPPWKSRNMSSWMASQSQNIFTCILWSWDKCEFSGLSFLMTLSVFRMV